MTFRADRPGRARPTARRAARSAAGGLAIVLLCSGLGLATAEAAPTQDLGDAPAGFDIGDRGPARASVDGPRLGSDVTADDIDPLTGVSVLASDSATRDSGDDAIAGFGAVPTGRLVSVSRELSVSRVTTPAQVCGWVDFDQTGNFTADERACTAATVGATSVRLTWLGRPDGEGPSYARFRIGTSAEVQQSDGAAGSGEVEDYPVAFTAAPVPPKPALTLTASVTPATVRAVRDVVTYTFRATNSGQTPLTGIVVNDELPGLGPLSCGDTAALAVGQSVTCTATRTSTQADLDAGAVFDYAQASAEGPDGDPSDPGDDVVGLASATVTAEVRPALQLSVKINKTKVKRGAKVTVTYRATNTGNVTVDRVRISGSLKGLSTLTCKPKAGARLAPDATMVCTGRYTVTKADAKRRSVTAGGSVRAEPPYGDPSSRSDDVVDQASAKLTVSRTPGTAAPSGSFSDGRIESAARRTDLTQGGGLADTGPSPSAASAGLGGVMLTVAGALMVHRRRRPAG